MFKLPNSIRCYKRRPVWMDLRLKIHLKVKTIRTNIEDDIRATLYYSLRFIIKIIRLLLLLFSVFT